MRVTDSQWFTVMLFYIVSRNVLPIPPRHRMHQSRKCEVDNCNVLCNVLRD